MNNYKTDDNEIIRLTISLGIVATAIGVIALGPSMNSSAVIALIKIGSLLLVISTFTYIMLTGLIYKYNAIFLFPKQLEKVRKRSYNFSVSFYWYAFFSAIYFSITETLGLSFEKSRDMAVNVLFFASIVLIFIGLLIVLYLKRKKQGARH